MPSITIGNEIFFSLDVEGKTTDTDDCCLVALQIQCASARCKLPSSDEILKASSLAQDGYISIKSCPKAQFHQSCLKAISSPTVSMPLLLNPLRPAAR